MSPPRNTLAKKVKEDKMVSVQKKTPLIFSGYLVTTSCQWPHQTVGKNSRAGFKSGKPAWRAVSNPRATGSVWASLVGAFSSSGGRGPGMSMEKEIWSWERMKKLSPIAPKKAQMTSWLCVQLRGLIFFQPRVPRAPLELLLCSAVSEPFFLSLFSGNDHPTRLALAEHFRRSQFCKYLLAFYSSLLYVSYRPSSDVFVGAKRKGWLDSRSVADLAVCF